MAAHLASIRRSAPTVLLVLSVATAGCGSSGGPFRPFAPRASVSPGDATPELAVRSLEWSWNKKSAEVYRTLFTQDYQFAFSALDPYGDAYKITPWNRQDEMASSTHLFVGGSPIEPPAQAITLSLGAGLVVQDDPRPGMDPRRHKYVHTTVALTVLTASSETLITGFAGFYLVRGDSALVPDDIRALGYEADSTRWYIDRWEDDTATPAGTGRAMPTKSYTVGALKAIYR